MDKPPNHLSIFLNLHAKEVAVVPVADQEILEGGFRRDTCI